ncbi:MAG: FAD:protein FMN transferase, partial [Prevotellaceae bacterium]|nr:FAD:protein FMN transferase [Prevotellaceae bacterium]
GFFRVLFTKAKEINRLTEGAFDISAEPLFRAWGFGSGGKANPDKETVEALKQCVGMDKIWLEGNRVVKSNPAIVLNANAVAKGYSVDVVADFLDGKACGNYLVEIGGEIRLKGCNPDGERWRVGIDKPADDNPLPGQRLHAVLQLTGKAVATSGNYRQFSVENGRRINHTINPATGYPVNNELLSVTVVAADALTADALATAAMVAGKEAAMKWITEYGNFDAVFIIDDAGELKTCCTEGIAGNIRMNL